MINVDLNMLLYAAIVPILGILISRTARNKAVNVVQTSLPATFKKAYGKKDHFAGPILKKCPKCSAELPLSTLICDTCDYNFLAGAVTHRHKMLPAPAEPLDHEVSGQSLVYHT